MITIQSILIDQLHNIDKTHQGDSGGPLSVKDRVTNKHELVGITSWVLSVEQKNVGYFTIISRFYQTLVRSLPLPSHSLTSLCFSPRQQTFWKFLKVKIHFTSCLFYIKTIIFLQMLQMYPILRMNYWFHAFFQIFVKLFAKKGEGVSEK